MFTKEELQAMPLKRLRQIDIVDLEGEKILQEVINEKEKDIIPDVPIKKSDIPDIQTPEEEAGWQKVVDMRVAAVKPQVEEVNPLKCSKCDFVAKSAFGLKSHQRKHK